MRVGLGTVRAHHNDAAAAYVQVDAYEERGTCRGLGRTQPLRPRAGGRAAGDGSARGTRVIGPGGESGSLGRCASGGQWRRRMASVVRWAMVG